MKTKELKQILSKIPDNYDIEIWIGHAAYEVLDVDVAKFGKAIAIFANENKEI